MRKLFTLAYPRLSEKDTKFIEEFRRRHDGHHELVRAHFTMVFGRSEVDERAYLEHVREVARLSRPTSFVCRYAMLGADDEAERAYVFLVPDEGYSAISRLHDVLYRREMASFLRLDIPFVPHITLGSSADRAAMKTCCDELNEAALAIHGSVEALTVAALEYGSLVDVASFSFKSGGA
jgi:2'-5' RNA ligase